MFVVVMVILVVISVVTVTDVVRSGGYNSGGWGDA